MRIWLRTHRIMARLLWAVLALVATEALLLLSYLSAWLTLPLL